MGGSKLLTPPCHLGPVMWTTLSLEMGSEGLGGGLVLWEGGVVIGEGVGVPGGLWERA